jgi:hypothetical protein
MCPPDEAGPAEPTVTATATAETTTDLDTIRTEFQTLTWQLTGFYDQVADQLAGERPGDDQPTPIPVLTGPELPVGVACADNTPPQYQPDMLWVGEYLYHLGADLGAVAGPAAKIAELRQRPWWR